MSESAQVQTETREETPLDQYQRRGYVRGDGREAKALDAAVALTASTWGPPFATSHDEAEGGWRYQAFQSACRAVENAIVDGVLGR